MTSKAKPRRRHRALFAAAAVGLAAAVTIAVLASRTISPGTVVVSPLGGKPAPSISGADLRSGQPVSLQALRGRYVIVTFFASWCPACQSEIRPLAAFAFEHRSGVKVTVLGVAISDNAADAATFLARSGASWSAVNDPNGSIAVAYGVADPPESFVVGPNGRVIAAIPGGVTLAALDTLVPSGSAA